MGWSLWCLLCLILFTCTTTVCIVHYHTTILQHHTTILPHHTALTYHYPTTPHHPSTPHHTTLPHHTTPPCTTIHHPSSYALSSGNSKCNYHGISYRKTILSIAARTLMDNVNYWVHGTPPPHSPSTLHLPPLITKATTAMGVHM